MTSTAIVAPMRAVVLEPDPQWLATRRRLGLDRFDEVWDGVLHVVPFPNAEHQRLEGKLETVLERIVEPLGLEVFRNFGIYDPAAAETNYRGPDLLVVDPKHVSQRGVEGRAELVVEILSPSDESRDKLPFYARCGIPEVWLVDPATRQAEIYILRQDAYVAIPPMSDGALHAPRFGLELRVVEGPRLRIAWALGSAEI
jgi:Uma2 family endonuclease